ncbi:MAG TPA: polysaccharide ABC transporter ATP-binding protein [Terracidiphilus sp.]|nr:polysaccharide ABC transporter ATP-binding protein [Terracidiphilus sp.]
MADDIVIRAEGLGKKYVIGHEAERERYVALRDVIARGAKNAWRMAADMVKGRIVVPGDTVEEFWALKDVNFEVKRGEVLGIIGRNGAGKSTILKVLSRITEPSEGRVTIHGRVASLLEVGTGFHPELSGRENIFLNGAILGMTRAEIKRKFDEIVAFAEVEKFLDTPVKRYSSGMYVRLAFAVAAHLEPEILVVDEVLAVGDAEFQKKCLGKMNEVASHGRTILFVSHNMGAVLGLCSRVACLVKGSLKCEGIPQTVVNQYLAYAGSLAPNAIRELSPDVAVAVERCEVEIVKPARGRLHLRLTVGLNVHERASVAIELVVRDTLGVPVGWASVGALNSDQKLNLLPGRIGVTSLHDVSVLGDGRYSLTIMISRPDIEYLDRWEDCLQFELSEEPVLGAERRLQLGWGFGGVEFGYISHDVQPGTSAESARLALSSF